MDNNPVILSREQYKELTDRIKELEARLIDHGICPSCDAELVVDYRRGKATNRRCKCGWEEQTYE